MYEERFGLEQKRSTVREMLIHIESGNTDEIGNRFTPDEAQLMKELA